MNNEDKLNALRCVVNVSNTDVINQSEKIIEENLLIREKLDFLQQEIFEILVAVRSPGTVEEFNSQKKRDSSIDWWKIVQTARKKHSETIDTYRNAEDIQYQSGFLMGIHCGIRELLILIEECNYEYVKEFGEESENSKLPPEQVKELQNMLLEERINNIIKLNLSVPEHFF